MKVADKRKDIAFGVNHKQLFNTNFVDGSDSCYVQVSDTTKMVRITNTVGIASYASISLPTVPQTDVEITFLVKGTPTTIHFYYKVSGQKFVTISHFTPTVGAKYVAQFDSTSEGSTGGDWYIHEINN